MKVLEQADGSAEQVMRSGDADQVNWILRQVVNGGTGTAAKLGNVPVAGKTGTTQDYRDAWFVGYTPKLTTAVWMGYPDPDENGDPRFMRNVRGRQVTGGSFPAQIWHAYMEQATAGRDQGDFVAPPPFGGKLLNSDLTTTTSEDTTTTLPECGTGTDSTRPCRSTTTTTDASSSTTSSSSSTSSSSTSSTSSSTTSTTAPASSTTKAPATTKAPTTTDFVQG